MCGGQRTKKKEKILRSSDVLCGDRVDLHWSRRERSRLQRARRRARAGSGARKNGQKTDGWRDGCTAHKRRFRVRKIEESINHPRTEELFKNQNATGGRASQRRRPRGRRGAMGDGRRQSIIANLLRLKKKYTGTNAPTPLHSNKEKRRGDAVHGGRPPGRTQ